MSYCGIPVVLLNCLLALLICCCASSREEYSYVERTSKNGLHPVVIVPGTGGSQLEARLTDEYNTSSATCRRWSWERDWFRIWFDVSVLVGPLTDCFAERVSLVYDPHADEFHNTPGVETRVPYFGTTNGMQYLDPSLKYATAYMSSLVMSIEEVGYIDGKSLFGAPYDFRYGPGNKPYSVGSRYVIALRELVEKAYMLNGDKQVIIVSHSLGGLWVLYFLNQQPLSWRQKYVKHFIPIAAPWGGTLQGMRSFSSGYSLGIPLVNPMRIRSQQRTTESSIWLLPVPEVFGNRTLVVTQHKNYSASDMVPFLRDIGFSKAIAPYQSRIRPLTKHLMAPMVPVTLIFSSGISTPETLIYGEHGFDEQPEIIEGDGDGTVNLCSLSAVISDWTAKPGQDTKVVMIPGMSHNAILSNDVSIKMIVDEILSASSHN